MTYKLIHQLYKEFWRNYGVILTSVCFVGQNFIKKMEFLRKFSLKVFYKSTLVVRLTSHFIHEAQKSSNFDQQISTFTIRLDNYISFYKCSHVNRGNLLASHNQQGYRFPYDSQVLNLPPRPGKISQCTVRQCNVRCWRCNQRIQNRSVTSWGVQKCVHPSRLFSLYERKFSGNLFNFSNRNI